MIRIVLIALVLAFVASTQQHSKCWAADRPNVIVIFTDDHGYSDLQCQGIQSDLKTPHIDSLAAGGVRMTSGYVTAPQCVPSRAGLLAGRSQNRFGVESNGLPLDGFNKQSTIAERLRKLGYATGMTGKWHLGPANEIVNHGFDDVYYKNANRPGWSNFLLDGSDCTPGPEPSKLYHLDANSEAACAFIRRHHGDPFFFYCAYRAPHVPLDAPEKYLQRFPGEMPERRRQALAMISAMDDGVGKIMKTLRDHGLEKKTMIWLIGDNGAPLKIHKLDAPGGGPGWDGSLNEPLNGEKGMLSEGGIRVPFLIYWKDMIPGGREYHHPVSSLDVAATAVALAGRSSEDNGIAAANHAERLDGVNLVPFLKDDSLGPPHETLYWRWIAQSAVREGKWKYLRGGQREYLFDLDRDREEKHNLIGANPEVAKRLAKKLSVWAEELQPAGLATKEMSIVWENYYDFYLDGKPAPRPAVKPNSKSSGVAKIRDKGTRVKGWVGRNCELRLVDGMLRVSVNKDKRPPFIAMSGLQLPGQCNVLVTYRCSRAGQIGVHWRESGQGDFLPKATVDRKASGGDQWQTIPFRLSGEESIIHLRLVLPGGGADISKIAIQDTDGKTLDAWSF